jgi:hypothetical protein
MPLFTAHLTGNHSHGCWYCDVGERSPLEAPGFHSGDHRAVLSRCRLRRFSSSFVAMHCLPPSKSLFKSSIVQLGTSWRFPHTSSNLSWWKPNWSTSPVSWRSECLRTQAWRIVEFVSLEKSQPQKKLKAEPPSTLACWDGSYGPASITKNCKKGEEERLVVPITKQEDQTVVISLRSTRYSPAW